MHYIKTSIFIAICFLTTAGLRSPVKLYKVSGMVTHTSSYCGGAAPDPAVLEELNTPKPLSGKVLYIRSGSKNSLKNKVLFKLVSAADGTFSCKLPAGRYCIIEAFKSKKLVIPQNNETSSWDSTCLANRWNSCDHTLTVKAADVKNVNINFHEPCFYNVPCSNYNGPMPPVSAPKAAPSGL